MNITCLLLVAYSNLFLNGEGVESRADYNVRYNEIGDPVIDVLWILLNSSVTYIVNTYCKWDERDTLFHFQQQSWDGSLTCAFEKSGHWLPYGHPAVSSFQGCRSWMAILARVEWKAFFYVVRGIPTIFFCHFLTLPSSLVLFFYLFFSVSPS